MSPVLRPRWRRQTGERCTRPQKRRASKPKRRERRKPRALLPRRRLRRAQHRRRGWLPSSVCPRSREVTERRRRRWTTQPRGVIEAKSKAELADEKYAASLRSLRSADNTIAEDEEEEEEEEEESPEKPTAVAMAAANSGRAPSAMGASGTSSAPAPPPAPPRMPTREERLEAQFAEATAAADASKLQGGSGDGQPANPDEDRKAKVSYADACRSSWPASRPRLWRGSCPKTGAAPRSYCASCPPSGPNSARLSFGSRGTTSSASHEHRWTVVSAIALTITLSPTHAHPTFPSYPICAHAHVSAVRLTTSSISLSTRPTP